MRARRNGKAEAYRKKNRNKKNRARRQQEDWENMGPIRREFIQEMRGNIENLWKGKIWRMVM